MQRNHPTPSQRRQRLRLLGGSCLLLLYLATATPLAAALTALLAAADRGHEVAVQQTEHGLQIVLHHECASLSSHRHGMVTRLLTRFAPPSTSAQPDHVIPFGTTDMVREISSSSVEPKSCFTVLDAFPASQLPPRLFVQNPRAAGFARPPPAVSGALLALRSTVLLV